MEGMVSSAAVDRKSGAAFASSKGDAAIAAIGLMGVALSIAIGVVAMVGWSFDIPVLTRFFSARSAMQPITAMCAILAGAGILLSNGIRAARSSSIILATLIVLAAAQTLIEYALGVDLGTDGFLFSTGVANQAIPYPYPGRMASPTAVAFLLVGVGLLLAHVRKRGAGLISSACATAVLILVIVALLGQFYMVTPLTGVFGFTQVSIPTALALGGASLGVLSSRPNDGWVRFLVGTSVSATAARWLLPVVVIVPIAVASLALRGSEIGLYPSDFRLAFTTAVTIVLLAGLALWGAWQLDRLVAVRQAAEALQKSEATLRAFFETEGLFAAITERQGNHFRYLQANPALAQLYDRTDLTGLSVDEVQPSVDAKAMIDRLAYVLSSGSPMSFEQEVRTEGAARWFAVTISPITGYSNETPRLATTAIEITDRKRAEVQQELLRHELGHRLKNVLTVVQSVASQTLRQANDLPSANRALASRLAALGEATDVLTAQSWEAADLRTLIGKALAAHGGIGERLRAEGPAITLHPQVTLALALALHELATNAAKYGALSTPSGCVDVEWGATEGTDEDGPRFHLRWREAGGPEVQTPSRRGFGSTMIERSLAAYFRGEASIVYPPEGVVFTLNCPLAEAGSVSELA
ncbi:hypothetical protein AV944_06905 [Sphingomonas sp. LK11]|nr:hypothetical protein AV944_06905 [Sphingomonas sp. LK11]